MRPREVLRIAMMLPVFLAGLALCLQAAPQGPPQAGAAGRLQRLEAAGIRHISAYPVTAERAALGAYRIGFQFDDSAFVYPALVPGHPQWLASAGGYAVSAYLEAGSGSAAAAHLAVAQRYADLLISQAITIGDAWMFPYDVDTKHYEKRWFSGLAQGSALSLFSELAYITGNAEYRRAADLTFASFFLFRPEPYTHDDWISNVDEQGYYWVEEYPRDTPDHVLNGHQFAIVGLHKYFMLTRDKAAERLVRAGVATMVHYAGQFRNPGWLSSKRLLDGRGEAAALFSLKHSYHLIHIDLYRYALAMTGDPAIAQAIEEYLNDDASFQRALASAGQIHVRIHPEQVVGSGAGWRRADAGPTSSVTDYFDPSDWHEPGGRERGVVPGAHVVEFRDAGPGWETPSPVTLTVPPGGEPVIDATYVRRYLDDKLSDDARAALIREYEKAVASHPRDGEAHFALGQLYELAAEPRRAEDAYRASSAVGWNALPAAYLARLLAGQGRLDDARREYDAALAQCSGCRPWHAEQAALLLANGDAEGAIAAYRRSIDDAEGSVAHDYALYKWLSSNKLTARAEALAVATFEAASRTPPTDSQSLFVLGALQSRRRHWAEAAAYLERAVDAAPRWRNARQLLGATYLRLGRHSDAMTEYEAAATVRPRQRDTLDELARVYGDALGRLAHQPDAFAALCARAAVYLPAANRPRGCL